MPKQDFLSYYSDKILKWAPRGRGGICSQSIRFIAVPGESALRELKTPWARGFSFLFAWRKVAEQSLASALALNTL